MTSRTKLGLVQNLTCILCSIKYIALLKITKYLALFGSEKYNSIFHKIRHLISIKTRISYVSYFISFLHMKNIDFAQYCKTH